MYIYTKPRLVPRNSLSKRPEPSEGLGQPAQTQAQTGPQGRYIPARGIDPATGQPVMSEGQPAPWAVVDVRLQQINCRFYENAPREMVLPETLPHTMEVTTPGRRFIGACHPTQACPPEVHEGARPGDPWRDTRCRQWLTNWNEHAPNVIASPEFREELTDSILSIANVTGTKRALVKPAEFLEVIYEREAKEKPIRVFSFIVLAASGGILTFQLVRNAVKKRAAEKRAKKKAKKRKGTKTPKPRK